MNRLVIIGNGFDLAHGLKTSYSDFFYWYWKNLIQKAYDNHSPEISDELCTINLCNPEYKCWNVFIYNYPGLLERDGKEIYNIISGNSKTFQVKYSALLDLIRKSVEDRGWVNIEHEYYSLLTNLVSNFVVKKLSYTAVQLNSQLQCLKEKLADYLRSLPSVDPDANIENAITEYLFPEDFSIQSMRKALENIGGDESISAHNLHYKTFEEQQKWVPKRVMLLCFNYTPTVKKYGNSHVELNFIHGECSSPDDMIFGYGDELDEDYKKIENALDNELLNNVKSVRYLETNHYRKLLEFIDSSPYQVLVMGHSCGNSDRTLLHTVFEHENCVSIKPFYYKRKDGTDNYLELVQNISRCFRDKELFRDRVVSKDRCSILR